MLGGAGSPFAASWLKLAAQPDEMTTASPIADSPDSFMDEGLLLKNGFNLKPNLTVFWSIFEDGAAKSAADDVAQPTAGAAWLFLSN